jgi:uncharacterized protein (TIGR02147 family)
MDHISQKPDIFSYFDFRLYLADLLKWLRDKDPKFTFQKLAETYKLNSRSHYIDIINGRKLTGKFLETYKKICELNENEAEYFKALVLYDQSTILEHKREYFKTISSFSSNLERITHESEIYLYLEHWYIPAMLSMLEIYQNENDHRVIAKYFNPPISAVQSRNAINVLIKLGMISWDNSKNVWIFKDKHFRCSKEAEESALKEFNKQMQKLGIDVVETELGRQTFSAQTISLSMQMRTKIDEMIIDLQRRILEQIKSDTTPEIVLQINLQTFQLSRSEQST